MMKKIISIVLVAAYGFFTEVGTDDMGDKVDRNFMKLDNAQF